MKYRPRHFGKRQGLSRRKSPQAILHERMVTGHDKVPSTESFNVRLSRGDSEKSDYPDWDFSWFFSAFVGKFQAIPHHLKSVFITHPTISYWCQDSVVGIKTGYGLFGPGRVNNSLLHVAQTGSRAQPASYTAGTGGSFTGGKAAEVWSSPLTPNKCGVKKMWIYTSTAPNAFMAQC
jgi:hypothetical protein